MHRLHVAQRSASQRMASPEAGESTGASTRRSLFTSRRQSFRLPTERHPFRRFPLTASSPNCMEQSRRSSLANSCSSSGSSLGSRSLMTVCLTSGDRTSPIACSIVPDRCRSSSRNSSPIASHSADGGGRPSIGGPSFFTEVVCTPINKRHKAKLGRICATGESAAPSSCVNSNHTRESGSQAHARAA